VTISQYFGHASHGSNSSTTSINPQQLPEIIRTLKVEWKREVEEDKKCSIKKIKKELKATIKMDFSQTTS